MSTALAPVPPAPVVEDSKFSRLKRWERGETPGPWEMQVHPTNRCNLKCKICWERRAEKEIGMQIYDKSVEVDDDRYLTLVDESAEMGVREWTIVGGGEPMVRDELVISMCERIHGHGMRAALHTNATRFKPSHFERLIEAGLDSIRVSIDGPTQELNDTIRGGGFEKAIKNLRLLKEMKESAGVSAPIVTLHPVITNVTYRHLIDLVELTKELGGVGVYLSHLIFERPDEEEGGVFRLSPKEENDLPKYIKAAQRRAREYGFDETFDQLLPDLDRSTESKPHLGRTCCNDGRMTDANCFEAWLSCIVHVTGEVGPCCVSYDARAQNIKEQSLRDAWLGPFMTDVRKRITTDDLPHFCAGCPTYITPRSEKLRYEILETLTSAEMAQWDKWADLSLPRKTALLAMRFSANLRKQGVATAVRRASEWIRTRNR